MTSSLVQTARELALSAHGDQRYGDAPYEVHLAAVVAVLERHGLTDPELLAAGWLHDSIEDTELSRAAVAAAAGQRVAAMVDAVSDGPGESRQQRKQRPYRLIPQTPGATLIKLADRIANVAACVGRRPRKLAVYRREHPGFRQQLHDPEDAAAAPLWAELDGLLARGD